MTQNKARKAAARRIQAETGKPYTAALHDAATENAGVIQCVRLAADLHQHMAQQGWSHPDDRPFLAAGATWEFYPGPVDVLVHRDRIDADGGDPDDGNLFDLTVVPQVSVTFPASGGNPDDPGARGDTLPGSQPPARIAARIRDLVADGRAQGLAAARRTARTKCSICWRRYPARHLVHLGDTYTLCPWCLYDQDVVDTAHPGAFVGFYDQAIFEDSAYPAAWAPTAVLIALLARHGGRSVKALAAGSGQGVVLPPLRHWADPRDFWVWLPTGPGLPEPLARFGAGARLGAVLDALDAAAPDLRDRYAAAVVEDLERDEEGLLPVEPDSVRALVEEFWPLLVAVAVCLDLPDPAGGQAGEWVEQFTDSAHTAGLFSVCGCDNLGDGFDYVLGGASKIAGLIAPDAGATPGD